MSEVIKEIKATRKEYLCDKCKISNVEYVDDHVYTHGGKHYKHECPHCKYISWLESIYPSQIIISE